MLFEQKNIKMITQNILLTLNKEENGNYSFTNLKLLLSILSEITLPKYIPVLKL